MLVVWVASTLRDTIISSTVGVVNRAAKRDEHAAGLEMVDAVFFYGVEGAADVLLGAMRSGVLRAPGEPATTGASSVVTPRLYIESVYEDSISWIYGTRTETFFAAAGRIGTVERDGEIRSGVVLKFSDVRTLDGVVASVGAMRALRHDVLAALRTIDPEIVEEITKSGDR